MRHRASCIAGGLALVVAACSGSLNGPGGQQNPPGTTTPALALHLGSAGFDQVGDVVADPDGSIYATGTFSGAVDFDAGTAVSALTSVGLADVYLAKYSAAGALVWVARIGGTSADTVTSLARDGSGNILIGGGFEGASDFDPGLGAQFLTSVGGEDGFVAKFTPAGTLVWARRFGGTSFDQVTDVTADASGNVYAAGNFAVSANALPATGPQIASNGSAQDGFVLSFDAGGAVRWVFPIGGAGVDAAQAAVLTSDGDVAVAGSFAGVANVSPVLAGFQLTSVGSTDAFLAKYTTAGAFRWAVAMGGTSGEDVVMGGLAADAAGGVAVSGSFSGTATFATGASGTRTSLGPSDWFVARFDLNGVFASVFAVGGTGPDLAPRIAFDAAGNLLATGSFKGPVDFDPGAGSTILASLATAGSDAFVARYTPTGILLWVTPFGESNASPDRLNAGTAVTADPTGAVLVGGKFFGSTSLGAGTSAFRLTSLGDADGFLVKLDAGGVLARNP